MQWCWTCESAHIAYNREKITELFSTSPHTNSSLSVFASVFWLSCCTHCVLSSLCFPFFPRKLVCPVFCFECCPSVRKPCQTSLSVCHTNSFQTGHTCTLKRIKKHKRSCCSLTEAGSQSVRSLAAERMLSPSSVWTLIAYCCVQYTHCLKK